MAAVPKASVTSITKVAFWRRTGQPEKRCRAIWTVPGSSETEFIESGHRRPTADVEVSSATRLAASRRRLLPVGRRVVVEPEELPDGEFV